MSAISNNAFPTGFGPVRLERPADDADRANDTPAPAAPTLAPGPAGAGTWAPLQDPPQGGAAPGTASWSSASAFESVMNELMGVLSNFIVRLGSLLGAPAGSAAAAPVRTPFATATAASVGDPHDSFDGRTAAGASAGTKWDDMHAHAVLLESDSFAGGYRVGTTVTAANAKGATHNARATVTTDGGATTVSLDRSGSYAVASNGAGVALQPGRAVSLGGGESVLLDADGSLRIDDTNGHGGSLTTTLSASDGGVDVRSTAHDVDLGGYLVTQAAGGN